MNTLTTLRQDFDDLGPDAGFDPVLTGVAHGLARLFPPIHNVRPQERDDDEACDRDLSDTDRTGHHTRS